MIAATRTPVVRYYSAKRRVNAHITDIHAKRLLKSIMIVPGLKSGQDSSATVTIDDPMVAFCKDKPLNRPEQDAGTALHHAIMAEGLQMARVERFRIDAIALEQGRQP